MGQENPENQGSALKSKERQQQEEKLKRRETIFYVLATLGAIIAAVGFLLEIFGILKEAGLALGVLGILMTLIFALWGTRTTIEKVRAATEGAEERLSSMIREEGTKVIEEIRKQSRRTMGEVKK